MSTTLPVSSTPPIRHPISSASSQSWLDGSISKEFKIGVAVVIGTVFAYLIYRYLTQEKPFKHLSAMGSGYYFIEIAPRLIPFKSRDVKVIVEDAEERRITSQYLNFAEQNFLTRLPSGTDVRVRVEVDKLDENGNEFVQHIGTSQTFQVEKDSERLKIVDFSAPIVHEKFTEMFQKIAWIADESYQQRPLKNLHLRVGLSETENTFVSHGDFNQFFITLAGEKGVYKAVQITLRQQLKTHERTFYIDFPVIDGEIKKLDFDFFIKTLKEQYKPLSDEAPLEMYENHWPYLVRIISENFELSSSE